ncbi:MAG: ATP synthase F1 subunit delta [Alphaproteobacteria bacterium]
MNRVTLSHKAFFTSLCGRYTKALFEIALKKNQCLSVKKAFKQLKELLESNQTFATTLKYCSASKKHVKAVLKEKQKKLNWPIVFTNFLSLLIHNKRFHLYEKMAHLFDLLIDQYENLLSLNVHSPKPFSKNMKEQLKKIIETKFNKRINLNFIIDARILSGFLIKTDTMVIDARYENYLDRIKDLSKEEILCDHV